VNVLDIAILVILLFCTLMSLYWGVLRQLLALGGLVVGVLAARRYDQQATTLVSSAVQDNPELARLIGFVLVVLAVSLVVSVIASLLRLFVGLLFLGWLDHVLGGLLGFVQGLLLISVVLAVASALPNAGLGDEIEGSTLAPLFGLPVRIVLPLLPEELQTISKSVFR